MGRTLHYTIKRDKGNFTRKELESMYQVSTFYNSKGLLKEINTTYKTKLKNLWTCENFWLGVGNYYPNWENNAVKLVTKTNGGGSEAGWALINQLMEKAEKETGSFIDAVFEMEKKGYILAHDKGDNEFHGFTKTQGNEFNSLLVFKALIEISKKVPSALITLSDEGEFLLCPLKIKNGKVLPIIQDMIEDIQSYSMRMLLSKEFKGNILKKLKHTDFKNEFFKNDIGVGNGYGDMIEYIDARLRNLKEIEAVLLKETIQDNEMYIFNIGNRKPEKWFKAESFVRPVNVERFLDYKMSPASLMDGFSGEGFDLTDKDSEAESYKMIAKMFSILGKAGFKNGNIQVLGTE